MDKRQVERVHMTSFESDGLEAAQNGARIVNGPRHAEDGSRIPTPNRVPGGRVKCSMRELDCLFGPAQKRVVAGQPEGRVSETGTMIDHEFQLFGRRLEFPALMLDPADRELRADPGIEVQPLGGEIGGLVEAALTNEEQPVFRMGSRIASLGLHGPLKGRLGRLPVVCEQHDPAAADGVGPLQIRALLQGKLYLSAGVAELRAEDDPVSFFQRADDALYRAKEAGKGRVVSANAPKLGPA